MTPECGMVGGKITKILGHWSVRFMSDLNFSLGADKPASRLAEDVPTLDRSV
jgi:hypothetical protein